MSPIGRATWRRAGSEIKGVSLGAREEDVCAKTRRRRCIDLEDRAGPEGEASLAKAQRAGRQAGGEEGAGLCLAWESIGITQVTEGF